MNVTSVNWWFRSCNDNNSSATQHMYEIGWNAGTWDSTSFIRNEAGNPSLAWSDANTSTGTLVG